MKTRSLVLNLLSLFALVASAQAQVTISNNPVTATVQGTVLGNSAGVLANKYWKAYGITMSASGTFDFTSLQMSSENEHNAPHTISGGIYTDSAGNPSSRDTAHLHHRRHRHAGSQHYLLVCLDL
jgi:hypothetical protein